MVAEVILGIETSCDETAAAVVAFGREVRSSVVSSQVDLHARFGGVVPEIASRAHLDLIVPVVAESMVAAGAERPDLDGVAVTAGPGLVGSLLVGLSAAMRRLAVDASRALIAVSAACTSARKASDISIGGPATTIFFLAAAGVASMAPASTTGSPIVRKTGFRLAMTGLPHCNIPAPGRSFKKI